MCLIASTVTISYLVLLQIYSDLFSASFSIKPIGSHEVLWNISSSASNAATLLWVLCAWIVGYLYLLGSHTINNLLTLLTLCTLTVIFVVMFSQVTVLYM